MGYLLYAFKTVIAFHVELRTFLYQVIRESCKLSVVEGTLRKLVDAGELKREGAGKSTYYIRLQ